MSTNSNPPPILSLRERTQIVAALQFWREVAEHSRTHPSRHPLFTKTQTFKWYPPIPIDEIGTLIEKVAAQ